MGAGEESPGRIGQETVDLVGIDDDTVTGDTLDANQIGAGDPSELWPVDREVYEIGAEIARGGMGVIREARDRRTNRSLAIKEVRGDVMARSSGVVRDAVMRFRREALLSAQLQHPSIVPVYEIGRFDTIPFIAMKRVSGVPLSKVIDEAPSLADRLALLPKLIDVAEAIAYAHSEGVIHRDLKPANVLVGDYGETVVIDWGLAKGLTEDDDGGGPTVAVAGDLETVAGSVFGTPRYMAPEQAKGLEVDARADVYSLGAILYELLCGSPPHADSELPLEQLIDLVAEEPPAPIAEVCPEAPADLVSIADKCMAAEPGDRYATAADLAVDLRAFQRGQLVAVHQYSTFELIGRWINRHKALVATAAALLILGAASTAWFVRETIQARDEAQVQLERAIAILRERGFDELARGNLQRAAETLVTVYAHRDDHAVRVAMGRLMRSIDPFERELHRVSYWTALEVDPVNRRIGLSEGSATSILDDQGRVIAELDGVSVAFIARGELIVTRRSNALAIWSASGEHIHDIPVSGVLRWSTGFDTDRIAVIRDSELIVYSARTGAAVARTEGTHPSVTSLAISANGRWAALTREQAVLFDIDAGVAHEIGPLSFASEKAIAFSEDGSLLAVATRPGQVSVVRTADQKIIRNFNQHDRKIDKLRFAGDRLIGLDVDGGLCSMGIEAAAHCDLDAGASSLAVGGDRIVSGHLDGRVTVRDLDNRIRARFAAHSYGETIGLLAGDGAVVSAGRDGAVRLWAMPVDGRDLIVDAAEGERLAYVEPYLFRRRGDRAWFSRLDDRESAVEIAGKPWWRPQVASDGGVILAAGAVWDASGARLADAPVADTAGLALHPDGDHLAWIDGDRRLVFAPLAGKPSWTADVGVLEGPPQPYPVRRLSFTRDGELLLVSTFGANAAFDTASGELVARRVQRGNNKTFSQLFVAVRGNTRFVTSSGEQLQLWSAERLIATRDLAVASAAVVSDGDRAIIGTVNGVAFFGGGDGDALSWLMAGRVTNQPITATASSARGLIAAATLAGRVHVFDRDGRKLADESAPHVRFLAFVGDRLVASDDRAVYAWSFAPETRDRRELEQAIERLVSSHH